LTEAENTSHKNKLIKKKDKKKKLRVLPLSYILQTNIKALSEKESNMEFIRVKKFFHNDFNVKRSKFKDETIVTGNNTNPICF